eukprot:TRINITY_DN5625_c0_g1_i1.p1 TRINITY_DN5625_c0_g1~~TRINITY_DN5625_c0_g1_i1.p1  ORF type:complete len:519 (-),score=140.27 TRINITY_DN5625_c0_g1_i1:58-1614(-)
MGNVNVCGVPCGGKRRVARRSSFNMEHPNNMNNNSNNRKLLNKHASAPGKEARKKSKKKNNNSNPEIPRILLLGAGESGKSTLSRQARLLHGAPFELSEKRRFADSIRHNTVTSAQNLVREINRHRIRLHKLMPGFGDDMAQTASARAVIEAAQPPLQDQALSEEVALAIAEFWAAPSVKLFFRRRDDFEFSIFDTAPHFWDRVLEIASRDYDPSVEDIMACRIRTTGIVETKIKIAGDASSGSGMSQFSLIDVGGQRSERLKWVHFFDDESVIGVLYVVAISEFNQVLFEDNKTNRLVEALELWKGLLNVTPLKQAALILFLNKVDIFEAKLRHVESFDFVGSSKKGIRAAFPDYSGAPSDIQSSLEFIQKKFEDALQDAEEDEKKQMDDVLLTVPTGSRLNNRASGSNDLIDIDLDSDEREGNNEQKGFWRSRSKSQSSLAVHLDSNQSKNGSRTGKFLSSSISRSAHAPPANKEVGPRQVFIHVTCATDTNQMAVVFQSLRKFMIDHSLRLSGLL